MFFRGWASDRDYLLGFLEYGSYSLCGFSISGSYVIDCDLLLNMDFSLTSEAPNGLILVNNEAGATD